MSQLKELLNRHDISPKKSLGQHFVIDKNIISRIIRFAKLDNKLDREDLIIEVGAGCGALTLELSKVAKKVVAIETDAKLLPALIEVLSEEFGGALINTDNISHTGAEIQLGNIKILKADVTRLNLPAFVVENFGSTSCKLVANLPYNISTRLILSVLMNCPQITELVVMVQKEVAQRLLADVNDTNFGLLSLKAHFFAELTSGGKVSPSVFYPIPRVDSELLRIIRKPSANTQIAEPIFALAAQAFSKRRKMLRKSLKGRVSAQEFVRAEVPETSRPQELSFGDWARLVQVATQ